MNSELFGDPHLRKSTRRFACALGRAWRCFRYKCIDHILNSEHECALLRLPRTMASIVIFPEFIRPIELTVDNGAFYARKEWFMASQEGIGKTYTCLCQRTDGQAVCVDVKLPGTTEGLYQNNAILVLLHEYGRFLGAYIMGI
jgi:hypothetical protein